MAYDVRRDFPYLAYDEVEFDVIVGTAGDCWDRFAITGQRDPRVDQDRAPGRQGDAEGGLPLAGQEGDAAATQPPQRVDGSSDPPLQAVHGGFPGRPRGTPTYRSSPPVASWAATWSPTAPSRPYRVHVRAPSFANLQALAPMARGRVHPGPDRLHLQHRPSTGGRRPLSARARPLDWSQRGRLGKDR